MSSADLRRRRVLQWAVLGGASLALSFGTRVALAHRTHVSLTRVTPNPRSGRWEIIHAVHYHDALKLLAARGVSDDTQPASVAGRARVALEVERSFLWRAGDGSSLQLFTVGAELEGDNVLVYQELQPPPKPTKIRVESNFLHDVFDDQVNNVSLEFEKPFVVLHLRKTAPSAEFDWRPSAAPAPAPQDSRRAK